MMHQTIPESLKNCPTDTGFDMTYTWPDQLIIFGVGEVDLDRHVSKASLAIWEYICVLGIVLGATTSYGRYN